MSGEHTPTRLASGSSTLVIAGEDIPFGAYQAIYHKLTKRVEKRSKAYKFAYDITLVDLQNLHERLSQLIKQYNVRSSRCQVIHQLKDDTSREHSSFEKFKISDQTVRSCSSRLNYSFDFLVVLPPEVAEAAEIAQRYTVTVLLDQENLEDSFDVPYFVRGLIFGKNINATIEFSDYAVSQALQATIDGWVDSLPTRKVGRLSKALSSAERTVRSYMALFARSACIAIGAFATSRAATPQQAVATLAIFLGIGYFFYDLIDTFIDRFYTNLTNAKPLTFLLLTSGDNDRKNDLTSKRNRAVAGATFLAVGIVLAVVLSVFSNYVYDAIKPHLF